VGNAKGGGDDEIVIDIRTKEKGEFHAWLTDEHKNGPQIGCPRPTTGREAWQRP
jgi:hypothetical protein